MKKLTLLMVAMVLLLSYNSFAKDKIRVGVYDSRAIAIWYFRSDANMKVMKGLMEDMKKAKEKNDSVAIKKIGAKGELLQKIAHDKGFGTGSVAEILDKYEKDIEAVAEKENLQVIVSKWELNFKNSDIELIDITSNLLKQLKASDEIIKMCDGLKNHKPVKEAFFIED